MSELQGADELLIGVIQDLRSYEKLADRLEAPQAIYAGHPNRPQDWELGITIMPVTAGSEHLGAGVSRNYRVQVTLLATWGWWDDQNWPMLEMQRVMSRVADRMDRANSMPNHRNAGTDAGAAVETEDGERMALSADWLITHAQTFE